MKELSIEEKAKRYDEALEKSKILYEQGTITESLCYVFPELKESEDEKERKKLINLVKKSYEQGGYALHKWEADEMLAWLEKQGEQKSTDKVEPKFKNGQWIVWQNKCYKVNYNGCGYELIDQNGLSTSLEYVTVDENAHLWTIQDAKDGDVLACESGWMCIFKTLVNDETFSSYCFMDKTKWFCETGSECHTLKEEFVKAYNGKIYPTTKEQRDLLFQKMKESGYEWDAENKELKKINFYCEKHCKGYQETGKCFADSDCKAKREAEQKSVWSEEDEHWRQKSIDFMKHPDLIKATPTLSKTVIYWLKSIKDRVQPKQEWKQENTHDLTDFENAMMHIGDSFFGPHAGLDPNDTNAIKEQATILLGLVPKQEWNKEDEERIKNIISVLDVQVCWDGATGKKGNPYQKEIAWLKSIRPQNRWKPSDEQIDALYTYLYRPQFSAKDVDFVVSLYQDLKKLREE